LITIEWKKMKMPKDIKPLPEGTILEGSLTVCYSGGKYYNAQYKCKCGRGQKAECTHPHFTHNGGISAKIAEHFGWRKINNKWLCPYCSGNTKNLDKLFKGD